MTTLTLISGFFTFFMASMTELILDFLELMPMYKVPSSLFYCEALTSLKLCNCCVSLPVSPTFRGFKNLKILYLRSAYAQTLVQTHYLLEKLISGSDVLEDLTLMPYSANLFNYVAPKLKHLCLGGQYIGFGFGVKFNSTFYSPIFHMEYHHENKSWLLQGSINLCKFITPLQSVETLKLDGDVLKYLSVEEAPSVLPELLLLLKNLFINGVNFKSVKELLLILCLLRSAPNLKQLKLLAAEKGMDIAEVDDSCAIEIRDSPSTFAQ